MSAPATASRPMRRSRNESEASDHSNNSEMGGGGDKEKEKVGGGEKETTPATPKEKSSKDIKEKSSKESKDKPKDSKDKSSKDSKDKSSKESKDKSSKDGKEKDLKDKPKEKSSKNKVKPDISLFMECVEEELSEAQKDRQKTKQQDFDKVMKQLEEMAKKGAKVTSNTDNSVTFKVTDSTTVGPLVPSTTATPATTVTSSVSGGVATYTCPPGYRLLLDPKSGRIIGSVPAASLPGGGGAVTNTVSSGLPAAQVARQISPSQQGRGGIRPTRPLVRGGARGGATASVSVAGVRGGRGGARGGVTLARGAPAARLLSARGAAQGSVTVRPLAPSPSQLKAKQAVPGAGRGGAAAAGRGGGAAGAGNPQVVDLTDPAVEPIGAPPIRLRKAFPALTVQARAQRVVQNASSKRSELDQKVKGLLVLTPTKFTEWLIQQRLVRNEQYEEVNGVKTKLKLGMYSDGKRFAASGGYVWLHGPESTNKYTSVLKGSIFEIAPTNALKLIYHWCCQTTITNVIQWVKVDNAFVDKFYTILRAVAMVSVQDKIQNMGGPDHKIEIGVISLGTSSSENNKREVRVEVLGVMDRTSRTFRIRASEPQAGATQQERFRKIFEMLPVWVNPASKLYTDYSVDKDTLTQLGFKNVVQCSLQNINNPSPNPQTTNIQVMDYLKKVVPKMFQNSLSSLSNNTLQQFLDELSYRESMARFPLECFNDIVDKISALTQLTSNKNESLESFLKKVANNPFLDWRQSALGKAPPVSAKPGTSPAPSRSASASPVTTATLKRPLLAASPAVPSPGGGVGPGQPKINPAVAGGRVGPGTVGAVAGAGGVRRATTPDEDAEAILAKKMKLAKEFVELETYYYGTLQGEESILASEFKADMAFKCQVCKKVFMNNIEFMKHLHLHIESQRTTPIDFADLSQCKYCYKDFDNTITMQDHIDKLHVIKGFSHVCQICNTGFKSSASLIMHMSRDHVKAEMPYACQVCEHRTSCHRSIIEHFTEMHDRTDKLQCPLCLKTYSLFNDKGYNSAAAQSYMLHLQKHENLKKKKLSCKKCCLEFVNDQVLKHHMEKDHVSYKDYTDIDTSQFQFVESAPIKMPKPDERAFRLAPKKTGPVKPLSTQYAFASVNYEDMAIYDIEKERCHECKRPMNQAGHYTAYLCCTKCRYSTCCSRAINIHGILFHNKAKPVFDLGKPVVLDSEVFCICGYATTSGHKMAKHLATQGCTSAYGSLEMAGEAREDKDLSPIRRLTPPATPTPPPVPDSELATPSTEKEGGEVKSKISLTREPRTKARKVAPTFMKEDFESDADDPDSDVPPADADDGDDDNYEPDQAELADKYVKSAAAKVNPDEDLDDPDSLDSDDNVEDEAPASNKSAEATKASAPASEKDDAEGASDGEAGSEDGDKEEAEDGKSEKSKTEDKEGSDEEMDTNENDEENKKSPTPAPGGLQDETRQSASSPPSPSGGADDEGPPQDETSQQSSAASEPPAPAAAKTKSPPTSSIGFFRDETLASEDEEEDMDTD